MKGLPVPAQSAPVRLWNFEADGDNYSVTRTYHSGRIAEYVQPFSGAPVYWIDAPTIPNAHRNVYLIDRAGTVTAYYVAGWSGAEGISDDQARAVLLYPMSAADPQSGYRWRIGPRRAYHLILSPSDEAPNGHPPYVPTPQTRMERTPLDDLRA